MTKKSKSNRNKSYVELRNLARKKRKKNISRQLGPKDRQKIIEETGLSKSTVYKALNKNSTHWSPSVIASAENIINNRQIIEP